VQRTRYELSRKRVIGRLSSSQARSREYLADLLPDCDRAKLSLSLLLIARLKRWRETHPRVGDVRPLLATHADRDRYPSASAREKGTNSPKSSPQQHQGEGGIAGKIITHGVARSLRRRAQGRPSTHSQARLQLRARARLVRVCTRRASSGRGQLRFAAEERYICIRHGIIQFAMSARTRTRARVGETPRATTTRANAAVAVRRLMENALLSLIAVLRLPTIQSHLSTRAVPHVSKT